MDIEVITTKTCGASKMYKTQIRKRALTVKHINLEAEARYCHSIDVKATPVTIIRDNGKEVARFIGYDVIIFNKIKEVLNGT